MLQRIVIFALLCLVFAYKCRLRKAILRYVKQTLKCRFLDFTLNLLCRFGLKFNLLLSNGCLLILLAVLYCLWV